MSKEASPLHNNNGAWYIVVALTIGTIINIMGHRLSSGMYKLIATSDNTRLGAGKMRVGELNSYELQQLGMAFNQMIDEISTNENIPLGVLIMDKNAVIKSINAAGKTL